LEIQRQSYLVVSWQRLMSSALSSGQQVPAGVEPLIRDLLPVAPAALVPA